MNVFEAIRENGITARQAAEHCGIKINRSGMAVCPFHKDKNPSMKIDSRYYCFGCGEKGDAIDFVAKFYGLGKKEAALRIASDFGISFEDNRGRKPPPKRKRRLSPEQRVALEKTMEKMERASQPETWFDGSKVNDVLFCEDFLAGHPMKCIHGTFFDVNGAIGDAEQIKAEIYYKIAPYVTSGIAKKATTLLDALRIRCYSPPIPYQTDRIHVANGTYFLSGDFSAQKKFCMNRLPVQYVPDAPEPSQWLSFVGQLLEPEDIITLQEFMGYVLQPTTKGQKMMIVIGKGGEGKSRIGRVLRALLGDSMNTGSIQKVEVDRFARADLEWKLLMLDDDMKLEALPQTNNIKSIVTLEDKTDLERKGKQSEQGYLCVRFICFGNGNLGSLYDRSYGFFRRQIVLTVKERRPDREDDPFLGEKLIAEAEGIFLWCLEGLHRLIDNGYRFTISQRAEDNLTKAMQDGNNIIVFMQSEGYIRLEKGTHATSKQLYSAYSQWCEDNLEKPLEERSFSNFLRQNEDKYKLTYTNNIALGNGKTARGFKGIHVKVRTGERH